MSEPVFELGDLVKKIGGRYGGPGRIVSISEELDTDGYRLYGVAMKVQDGYGEFIHVFPAHVLERRNEQSEEDGAVFGSHDSAYWGRQLGAIGLALNTLTTAGDKWMVESLKKLEDIMMGNKK
jgi:hypothetical protein